MAHEHEHGDHEHNHGGITFAGTEAASDVIALLKETHQPLGELVELSSRFASLSDEEKAKAVALHDTVLEGGPFMPGWHAEGDSCAVCGIPTLVLFTDTVNDGKKLAWSVFAMGLPVHPKCVGGFRSKYPRFSRRDYDVASRKHLNTAAGRPSPELAMHFRAELLQHPGIDPGQWAEGVFNASVQSTPDPKALARDLSKLASYLHGAVWH
ncbi:MAG TPA: hypothetical protein VNZ52_00570 [Candidatus Thermoplasmatota archaeon]|nr:hypothetical protein [Candidatus Thermoplasmatota archaeon]